MARAMAFKGSAELYRKELQVTYLSVPHQPHQPLSPKWDHTLGNAYFKGPSDL